MIRKGKKKLVVQRLRVRRLTPDHLQQAAGGISGTVCVTRYVGCPN